MMAPRNVPLIERRADLCALDDKMKAHLRECPSCGTAKCATYRQLAAARKSISREIAHWSDPAPGTPGLF